MSKLPIIIDTDPGVDDFFCIALGLTYSDLFDLQGITTMGGNNYTEVTTQNALNIVSLFGKDTPIVKGSTSYLKEEFSKPVTRFHGANGLGDITIPQSDKKPLDITVEDFIYQTAKKYSGQLIIVPVGPLTNIARSFLKYPDLKDHLKKIVLMGGSTDKGNITKYAEANIGHDRFAADIVFKSGVPIDMIGLNVTLKANLPREVFDPISTHFPTEIRKVMQGLIDFRNGEPMHDAVAISSIIDENALKFEDAHVHIELEDQERLGQTICYLNSNNPNCRVATSINLDNYYNIIKNMF